MGNRVNIRNVLITLNTVIFLILSLLHFYWAAGGTAWHADVLPTNTLGIKRMTPGLMATLFVAFGLLLLAFITIGNRGIWDKHIDGNYFRYGAILIALVFFLRAIGDFRFFGFFKSIKGTRFAINDTQLFSPLCLFIAVISLLIIAHKKSAR